MNLKALALGAGAVILAATGLYAAALSAPGLVDGPALREALVARLGDWAGGEVAMRGPVRLKSLFSLTLEAENVEIKGARHADNILWLKAGRLSARLHWLDVITGRPNFSELTLDGVTMAADAASASPGGAAVPGLASFKPLFEASRKGWGGPTNPFACPFARIRISNGSVAFASHDRRAHPRLRIVDMRLDYPGDGVEIEGNVVWRNEPFSVAARTVAADRGDSERSGGKPAAAALDVFVYSRLFDLAAAGEVSAGAEEGPKFKGEATLTSLNVVDAARWLKIGLPESYAAGAFAATGRVSWKSREFSVDHLEAGLDDRRISGALTLKAPRSLPGEGGREGARAEIDGSLALSDLDLAALARFPSGQERLDSAPGLSGLLETVDADLRLSVKRLSAGNVAGGSAALTLLARNRRLSADLADFVVMGGRVRGHFVLDASQPQRSLVIRATASELDSAEVTRIADMPGWLKGGADLNIEVRAEAADWSRMLQSLTGEVKLNFAEGGSMGLNLLGLTEPAEADAGLQGGLSWSDRGVMRFDALRGEFVIEHGLVRSKTLELSAGDRALKGRCALDLPGQTMDWRFGVQHRDTAESEASQGGDAFSPAVIIEGPWRRPRVHVGAAVPILDRDRPIEGGTHLQLASPKG
jgi:uncharacterized protein involved in outer membrane biogenesis